MLLITALSVVLLGIGGFGTYQLWPKRTESQKSVNKPTDTVREKAPGQTTPATQEPKAETLQPQSTAQRDATILPVEQGLAPVISAIDTKQPVVFLTIDDGITKDTAQLPLLEKHGVKASLYLTYQFIKNNADFFKDFVAAGHPVQNHTMTHPYLSKLSYAEQKQEICDQADNMEKLYGRRPVFIRPPGGFYNDNTRRAAADCGMKAIVMWTAKANGGKMEYQVGDSLRPGDIVLMHFRPEFAQDLQSFVDATHAAGLRTELLEDWLPD